MSFHQAAPDTCGVAVEMDWRAAVADGAVTGAGLATCVEVAAGAGVIDGETVEVAVTEQAVKSRVANKERIACLMWTEKYG